MRHEAGKSWRRGVERRETRRGGFGLLYCVVAQSLDFAHCTNKMGEHSVGSWLNE